MGQCLGPALVKNDIVRGKYAVVRSGSQIEQLEVLVQIVHRSGVGSDDDGVVANLRTIEGRQVTSTIVRAKTPFGRSPEM